MIKKIFFVLKKIPFLSSDTSSAELTRTYIVGGFNLVFGLFLVYIFQFFILNSVQVPLRTYLTNIFGFTFGVIISYFLSRRIIFKLSFRQGRLKEFISFVFTNLINLFAPLIIWY